MKLEQPGWTREIPTEVVVGLATLGPVGQRLKAPGTFGSLAGTLYFALCFSYMGLFGSVVMSLIGTYFAIGICGEAEKRMGRRDPGEVILDEVVAMPICFLGWQWIAGSGTLAYLGLLIAGFALFRLFDITKPWVIDSLQELPGGWGVVIDDTAAALATCATLHLAHALWVIA